jgi:hypothetical protein
LATRIIARDASNQLLMHFGVPPTNGQRCHCRALKQRVSNAN